MATVLLQDCRIVFEGALSRFRIVSSLESIEVGDLPHAYIFVHKIVDATDPKSDEFQRIASLADLTTLKTSRDTAVRAADTLFLGASCTNYQDNVSLAVDAKVVVQARVDDLILGWRKFTQSFLTPTSVVIPLVEASLVTAAKNNYTLAKTETTTATTALATANTNLTLAQHEATFYEQDYNNKVEVQRQVQAFSYLALSAETGMASFRTASSTFMYAGIDYRNQVLADGAVPGPTTTFGNAITTYGNVLNGEAATTQQTISTLSSQVSSYAAVMAAQVAAALALLNVKKAAVTTAQAAVASAETTLATAQANEASTLAAVLDVCPNFNPVTGV